MVSASLHLVPPERRGRVEHHLPHGPESIWAARMHARRNATGLLDERGLADLELIISEVVTNAVRHGGGGEILLAMTPRDGLLCVQVTDGGAGFVPVPRAMASDEMGGFGLFLVERLTRRWGMTREAGRTRVWFELDLPR